MILFFLSRLNVGGVPKQFTSVFDVIQLVGHKSFIYYLGDEIRQKKYWKQ